MEELETLFKVLFLTTFKEHGLWPAVAVGTSLVVAAFVFSLLKELFKTAKLQLFRKTASTPLTTASVAANSIDRRQDFNFCKSCEQRVDQAGQMCASCQARSSSGEPSIKESHSGLNGRQESPGAARPHLMSGAPEPY